MNFLLRSLLVFIFMLSTANAETTINIEDAWINAAPPAVHVVAAYMTIENKSPQQIDLVSAKSKLFERVEFHLSYVENDVAKMRKQVTVPIPAQSELIFAPGAYHLMLINNTMPIKAGDQIPIELAFSDGQQYQVIAKVKPMSHAEHHH